MGFLFLFVLWGCFMTGSRWSSDETEVYLNLALLKVTDSFLALPRPFWDCIFLVCREQVLVKKVVVYASKPFQ